MIEYFADVENYYRNNGLRKPKGCSEIEIKSLEDRVGFALPSAYVSFLKLMGRDSKGVLCGTNCFINDVEENTQYLPELLFENGVEFDLPSDYLAFFCHQGYIISWFSLPKESENPTCYLYCEGSTDQPIEQGRFKQFITSEILSTAKVRSELKNRKPWWKF